MSNYFNYVYYLFGYIIYYAYLELFTCKMQYHIYLHLYINLIFAHEMCPNSNPIIRHSFNGPTVGALNPESPK